MKKEGKFIVFEGLDGCGTSTQCQILANKLKETKIKNLITFEPTNNIIGGMIKGALTKQWETSPQGLQLLFTADRAHHLEWEILPALKRGQHVICDRYTFSTIAFGGLSCEHEWLIELNKYFRQPDLIIYLKTPPQICIERINSRGLTQELFEEENKLEKVAQIYDILSEKNKRTVIIDGNRPKDIIADEIWKNIQSIFDKKTLLKKRQSS